MNGTRIPEGIAGVTDSGTDHLQNHYEAPSCLVRNPSGSLFIPSSGNFRQIILSILVRAMGKDRYYFFLFHILPVV